MGEVIERRTVWLVRPMGDTRSLADEVTSEAWQDGERAKHCAERMLELAGVPHEAVEMEVTVRRIASDAVGEGS